MLHRIIVDRSAADRQWVASFADAPRRTLSGEWPSIAIQRLVESEPGRDVVLHTLRGREAASGHLEFTVLSQSDLAEKH